ncbi:CocE/NonD family hydrolase [Thermodesulfobacteriota bacterium]
MEQSQPIYKTKVKKDVFVTMRDGVKIGVNIFHPDKEGKFPALLSYSAYGKDMQGLPAPKGIGYSSKGSGGNESGISDYFVSRGYVHVIGESRGTGVSEGKYVYIGNKEQEDGHDLVEWIAEQPWCDGNVGMLGMSYFAMVQYLVAAQNPPHLKAIFAYEALTDQYRHLFYHGGLLNMFNVGWYNIILAHSPDIASYKDFSEAELKEKIDKLKNDEDIKAFPYLYMTTILPEKNPVIFDALMHPNDGPFWWERSAYTKFDQIKVPCYCISRWNGWPIHLSGAFSAYEGIQSPKKLMIMMTSSLLGPNRPWHEDHDVALRWYDHWLKGIDTGIMDEPPIKLLIQGTDEWRYEHEWPLARTEWVKYYLGEGGSLSESPPAGDEKPDSFSNIPWLKPRLEVPGVIYTTAPLKEDIEITGPITLYMYASIDTEDADWIVNIKDIAPDGSERLLTKGWLKASHREIDESRSKSYKPFHPHTRSQPVEPGKVYEYAIEIRETSNVFKKGHQIQLAIKGQDSEREEHGAWYHMPKVWKTHHTIHHSQGYPSYLLLPIIPKA